MAVRPILWRVSAKLRVAATQPTRLLLLNRRSTELAAVNGRPARELCVAA